MGSYGNFKIHNQSAILFSSCLHLTRQSFSTQNQKRKQKISIFVKRERRGQVLVFLVVSFQALCERLAFRSQARDERGLFVQGILETGDRFGYNVGTTNAICLFFHFPIRKVFDY